MKNTLSIIITLSILLSGSSMAAFDSILEQFSKLEISGMKSNLWERSRTCSHLDALIANNSAMPEAWLPQPCCEQEAKLNNIIEMIKEQDLRDYLSQFEDCGEVADKLLSLKDHEYYHYILFHTVMGLKRHCSTQECGLPDEDGTPALFVACQNGNLEEVSALLATLTNNGMDQDVKKQLLAGKLSIACENGHPEAATALMAAICSDDLNLTNTEKTELLVGQDANGKPALYTAFENGSFDIVDALISIINP